MRFGHADALKVRWTLRREGKKRETLPRRPPIPRAGCIRLGAVLSGRNPTANLQKGDGDGGHISLLGVHDYSTGTLS